MLKYPPTHQPQAAFDHGVLLQMKWLSRQPFNSKEWGGVNLVNYERGGAMSFVGCQLVSLPGSLDSYTYMKIGLVKFSESHNKQKCCECKKWIYGIRDR